MENVKIQIIDDRGFQVAVVERESDIMAAIKKLVNGAVSESREFSAFSKNQIVFQYTRMP